MAIKVINERPRHCRPGNNPMFSPTTRPTAAAALMPIASRFKLAQVSLHSRMVPLRLSVSRATFLKALEILDTVGSSLSWGLAVLRISDAIR